MLVAGLVFWFLYLRFSANTNIDKKEDAQDFSKEESTQIRVEQLEKAVAALIKKIDSIQTPSSDKQPANTAVPQGIDARLNNVESALASMLVTVNQLKAGASATQNTTTQTTSTKQPPSYIPLGWQGSISTTDWSSATTQTFIFDPADYPGFKNLVFEANLQVYQGNGTAYARLYNSSDSTFVYGTEVSTTSQSYLWVSSSSFNVPTSKKTYVLQLKTNTGYAAMVENARIKVNF